MADITGKSPVRTGVRGQFPLNKMHSTTSDFFRWDVVHMFPMVQNDVVSLNVHTFIDSAPNPYPINGKVSYGMYSFFIPYRLLWDDWKFYITGLKNITQPYFTLEDLWEIFNNLDYAPLSSDLRYEGIRFISNIRNLGAIVKFLNMEKSDIPDVWLNHKFNAYALRAIQHIWWDWMRDKVHISDASQPSYVLRTGGHITRAELALLCTPKYRCFPKNYITTAFDTPQEGGSSVQAVRIADNVRNPDIGILEDQVLEGQVPSASGLYLGVGNGGSDSDPAYGVGLLSNISPDEVPGVGSALSLGSYKNIGQFGVNDFRLSSSVQQFKERLLLAGKTVLSRALALFGVAPTIEELQMSNYLGGHEEDLYFKTSDVGTTASLYGAPEQRPDNAYGLDPRYGTIVGQKYQSMQSAGDNGFGLENITYKSDETGFLVVMGCLMPLVQYFQGLPRDWFRGTDTLTNDRTDYYHTDFENQPLQAVPNIEVCCSSRINPKGAFGFQEMYVDYKLEFDSLGGDFVLPDGGNLYDKMTLGRDIEQLLSDIAQDPDDGPLDEYLTPAILTQSTFDDKIIYDRLFTIATANLDHFRLNHKIDLVANRPMMQHSLPSLDAALSRMTAKQNIDTGGFRL